MMTQNLARVERRPSAYGVAVMELSAFPERLASIAKGQDAVSHLIRAGVAHESSAMGSPKYGG